MKKEHKHSHSSHETEVQFRARLKLAGLKYTKGRQMVQTALIQSHGPIGVDEMMALKICSFPDRVTVYRILEQFVKAGIAKEIRLNDLMVRYEYQNADQAGCCHHVVCKDCGTVSHVESPEVEKALKVMMKNIKGFTKIDEHRLEFVGHCTDCSK